MYSILTSFQICSRFNIPAEILTNVHTVYCVVKFSILMTDHIMISRGGDYDWADEGQLLKSLGRTSSSAPLPPASWWPPWPGAHPPYCHQHHLVIIFVIFVIIMVRAIWNSFCVFFMATYWINIRKYICEKMCNRNLVSVLTHTHTHTH